MDVEKIHQTPWLMVMIMMMKVVNNYYQSLSSSFVMFTNKTSIMLIMLV